MKLGFTLEAYNAFVAWCETADEYGEWEDFADCVTRELREYLRRCWLNDKKASMYEFLKQVKLYAPTDYEKPEGEEE